MFQFLKFSGVKTAKNLTGIMWLHIWNVFKKLFYWDRMLMKQPCSIRCLFRLLRNFVVPKYLQFAFYAERFYELFANHGLLDVKKCVFKCWAFAAKVYIGIKWLKEMMLTNLQYIYLYIKSLLINVPYNKYWFICVYIYI